VYYIKNMKTDPNFFESIRNLIKNGKTKEAIEGTMGVVSTNSGLKSELISAYARLVNLNKEINAGTISSEASDIRENSIRSSLLSILDEIENNPDFRSKSEHIGLTSAISEGRKELEDNSVNVVRSNGMVVGGKSNIITINKTSAIIIVFALVVILAFLFWGGKEVITERFSTSDSNIPPNLIGIWEAECEMRGSYNNRLIFGEKSISGFSLGPIKASYERIGNTNITNVTFEADWLMMSGMTIEFIDKNTIQVTVFEKACNFNKID